MSRQKPKTKAAPIKKTKKSHSQRILQILSTIKKSPNLFLAWFKSIPSKVKKARTNYKKRKAYKSFHLQKKLKSVRQPLPSAYRIFKDSWKFIVKNWKVMFVLIGFYALIYIVFLAPSHTTNFDNLQSAINQIFGASHGLQYQATKIGTTIGFTLLNSGQTSAANVVVGLAMSLIFIWSIRHLVNKRKIKARDAIYQGLGPFVPFVLILLVITLESIPALIMSFLYNTAKATNLLTTGFENFVFFLVLALIVLLCLYWATSAIIALYIVTLPGMYPMKALRSAKKLVMFRRFEVFRKIVALPILLLIVYGIVLVAVVVIKPTGLVLTIDIITVITLPLFHTYMYKVYRALL